MNTLRTILALAAALSALSASQLFAQSGTLVAVLDVGKVFKEHRTFNQKMEAMKAEVKSLEDEIKNTRQGLVDKANGLQRYKSGTNEYRQIEGELAKGQSDLQVRMQLKRKEFIEREAKLFYDTYQEIVATVARLSEQYQINLVLRYNSAPIDATNPNDIQNGVNRYVVYQKKLDITRMVIDSINK